MKKYNINTRKKIIVFIFISLLLAVGCWLTQIYRPVRLYTIYTIAPNEAKEKVAVSRSLDDAQKIMKKKAIPSEKINSFVENDEGSRVAIAYGLISLTPTDKSTGTAEYYFEYKDRMQNISPAFSADGLYSKTVLLNSSPEVFFQQSAAVGQIPLEKVELLNIFDDREISSLSYYEVKSDILYHHITTDPTKPGHTYTLPLGSTRAHLANGIYYSWDGLNFYKNIVKMVKDKDAKVNTYNVPKAAQYSIHVIPFIYCSLLQASNYTVTDLDAYIREHLDSRSSLVGSADVFFEAQKKYKINAMALFAMICQETNYGMDHTVPKDILKYTESLVNGYLDKDSPNYAGDFLGNKAVGMNVYYSNDPYWGEKVASIYIQINEALGGKDTFLALSKERHQ